MDVIGRTTQETKSSDYRNAEVERTKKYFQRVRNNNVFFHVSRYYW